MAAHPGREHRLADVRRSRLVAAHRCDFARDRISSRADLQLDLRDDAEGLKRDEDVPPEQSIAPQTARRMNRMIIAVLVIALGYFVFDKFVLSPRREAALVAARPAAEPKPAASPKSVAVLAFANLSDDKGSEYFSDGVSEELLTVLQKFPACTSPRGLRRFPSKARMRPPRRSGRNSAWRIWSKEACARPATSCASRRGSLRPRRASNSGRKTTRVI